jgi:hypothetical protein
MVPGYQVVLVLMQVLLRQVSTLHFIRKISLPVARLSVGIQGLVSLHFH